MTERDDASSPADEGRISVPAGLSEIEGRFDAILCDIWGVLHDGARVHPDAWRALARARSGGKTVVLMSNAPRPGLAIAEELRGFGIPDDAYDGIVTSGDLTRDFLARMAGPVVLHIGPVRDEVLFEDLDVRFADLGGADLIVCTDLRDEDIETPDDYRDLLSEASKRGLPLLCSNPDIVVERGVRHVHCAGAIARSYEQMGGRTIYVGKPHPLIYTTALSRAASRRGGTLDPRRVLCIGDALHTDMAGAAQAGLASLFIAEGIHANDLELSDASLLEGPSLTRLFSNRSLPVAALRRLIW